MTHICDTKGRGGGSQPKQLSDLINGGKDMRPRCFGYNYIFTFFGIKQP